MHIMLVISLILGARTIPFFMFPVHVSAKIKNTSKIKYLIVYLGGRDRGESVF